MSNGFEATLHIPLRAGKRLAMINLVAHLATGAVLGSANVPLWLLPLFLIGTIASYWRCAVVHVRRTHPRAIVLLVLESDGSWTLYRRAARPLRKVRLDVYFVCADWVVAHYKSSRWRGWSVVLAKDTTHAVIFRRLKMHLRG